MKKILFIVSRLRRSGPINQIYNLIKYMDRAEFDPYVITLSPESTDTRWVDFTNLDIALISLGLSRVKGIFFAVRRIRKIINEIDVDIIHSHGIRADILSSIVKTNKKKINTVHSFMQIDYEMTYGYFMSKIMTIGHIRALRELNFCIGVSEGVSDYLKKTYNLTNTAAIKNGIDTEVFYPVDGVEKKEMRKKLNLPLDVKIWISSGVLTSLKDPEFIIESWINQTSNNGDHLVFIGSGELAGKCKKMTCGVESIHILGNKNQVVDYLQACDFYVSASKTEGLPMAVLEAMACGLPVLLSDIEPHREILNLNPDAGFCYRLGDSADFLEKKERIISQDRSKMSLASLDVITKALNAKLMSKKYQELYRKIMTDNRV